MFYSNILVAYDGSNLSRKALAQAVKLAEESRRQGAGGTLDVVYVQQDVAAMVGLPYILDPNESESILAEAKLLVPPALNASFTALRGQPAGAILRHAQERRSDLIVMGSRGLGAIREFFLGSVSHHVVQQAAVPVLVIK